MTRQEKVIKALQKEIDEATYPDRPRKFMFPLELAEQILAMLEAQEPRVMTLGEISSINGGDLVWIEDRSLDEMIAGIKYQSPSKNCYYVILIGSRRPQPFSKELYEVNWRCWTSHPSDEQRRNTPWT